MSALERLGLEVVAYTMLGSRKTAAFLLALIDANGKLASYEALSNVRAWKMDDAEPASRKSVQVRICLLRDALEDLGLRNLIITHENGYALPEPGRSVVMGRLVEEVAA